MGAARLTAFAASLRLVLEALLGEKALLSSRKYKLVTTVLTDQYFIFQRSASA
jgi:hypothetical protein